MLMNFILFLPLFMLFMGLLVFLSNRKHLLITLLSLEFVVLSLFMYLFFFLLMNISDMYLMMVFLVMVVCEGALGLSILVSMVRTHGNNYFQSFNSLMC